MDVRERQQRFSAGARARAERLVTAAAMSRADVAAADEAGEAVPAGDDQVEQVPELLSVGIEAGGGDDAARPRCAVSMRSQPYSQQLNTFPVDSVVPPARPFCLGAPRGLCNICSPLASPAGWKQLAHMKGISLSIYNMGRDARAGRSSRAGKRGTPERRHGVGRREAGNSPELGSLGRAEPERGKAISIDFTVPSTDPRVPLAIPFVWGP
jgi:hypothetical protein